MTETDSSPGVVRSRATEDQGPGGLSSGAQSIALDDLLRVLGYRPDEHVSINRESPDEPFTSSVVPAEQAAGLVARYRDTHDLWFGVNPVRRLTSGRGAAADVTRLAALVADLDFEKLPDGEPTARAVIDKLSAALGSAPAAVVRSGHGLHPYWPLHGEGTDLSIPQARREAEGVLWRWRALVKSTTAEHGGRADSVFDLPRVLRVPGTVNRKGEPAPVETGLAVLWHALDLDALHLPEPDPAEAAEAVPLPDGWSWSEGTCGYVRKMLDGWAIDVPDNGRHPWLFSCCVRLGAAKRLGCISEDDHAAAVTALRSRFGELCERGLGGEVRRVRAHRLGTEVDEALCDGEVRAARKSEAELWAELGRHEHEPVVIIADTAATFNPASAEAELWRSRPVLAHLHAFARARGVAPLAVLGVAMARVAAAIPAGYVLPALVGGPGTLNLFVALVGPSGVGKGAAHAAAEDALDLSGWRDPISGDGDLHVTNVGSGEGILHAYARWSKGEGVQQIRESVLFVVPEIDQLTAVGSRQGATLLPKLREAYSGEALSFNYADPTKRLTVRRLAYRMALTVGVQPDRAAALLDDAGGGTPQRFVWLPATDPQMPRRRPVQPEPRRVALLTRPPLGRAEIAVCLQACDEITEAHWRRSRGEGDALDGHARYTRLKVAAALAVLDGHLGSAGVTVEDWRLAGVIMAVSDATRTDVQAELRRSTAEANKARAKTEAVREIVRTEIVEAAAVQKAGRAVVTALTKRPGEWMTGAELRRALPSRVRPHLDTALDALVGAASVEVEEIDHHGQPGRRYRSRS